MRPRQIVLLAVIAVAASLAIWLASRNPKPPWIPRDSDHTGFVSGDSCMICHGPEGPSPQSRNHPVGMDCLRCHGFTR